MTERGEQPEQSGKILKFDANEALKRRLTKTGELDAILDHAGEEMAVYEERKAEGKETQGKWTVSVVDTGDENAIRQLVGKEKRGRFILLPNDAEHIPQEHIFTSDREAEVAIATLKTQFSAITGHLEFHSMCGGIDEKQE